MALNQNFNRKRVNSIPTSGLKAGDRYDLNVGGDKYKTVVISDLLQPTVEAGAEFIEKDTMADFRAISEREIWAIQQGYYKGVKLNGYYTKGDTPSPIEYFISTTSGLDNAGSVIEVNGLKFEHIFLVIDPLYFGAKGDGVSDDSNAIEACLKQGISINNNSNTFVITKQIAITDISIDISGLKVKIQNIGAGKIGFIFNETSKKTGLVNNATTINELSRNITLDDITNIDKGDLLVLKCIPQTSGNITIGKTYVITSSGGNFLSIGAPNNNIGTSFIATGNSPDYGAGGALLVLWDYDPRPGVTNTTLGEVVKVVNISGNTVIIDKPLSKQYLSTYKIGYTVYKPKEVSIKNLQLYSDSVGDFGGIVCAFKSNALLENVMMDKVSGSAGVSINQCYDTWISNCKIDNGYYSGTPTGYGVQCNGSNGTTVKSCSFNNNRRAVDFSGDIPSVYGSLLSSTIVSNDASNNSGSCVGTHGGADLTTFQDNKFIGGIVGVQTRSPRVISKNNIFVGQTICCHSISFGDNITIDGNKLEKSLNYSNLNTSYFIQLNTDINVNKNKPIIVTNNIIEELRISLLQTSYTTNTNLGGFVIGNNTIVIRSNANENLVGYFVNSGAGIVTLRDSNIFGNQMRTITGFYKVGHNFDINQDFNKGDLLRQFSISDFQTWGGEAGVLSDVDLNVFQRTVDNDMVNVVGNITFTVSGGIALLVLKGALKASSLIEDFYSRQGDNLRVDTAGSIYIGYRVGDAYNARFPVGTYNVNFNITYKINPTSKY